MRGTAELFVLYLYTNVMRLDGGVFQIPHGANSQTVSGKWPMTVDKKHFGKTKDFFLQILGTNLRRQISADNKQFLVFSFPTLFSHPSECVGRLSHIAVNLFATQATALPKQTNTLQSPTHFFGFFKAVFGYP